LADLTGGHATAEGLGTAIAGDEVGAVRVLVAAGGGVGISGTGAPPSAPGVADKPRVVSCADADEEHSMVEVGATLAAGHDSPVVCLPLRGIDGDHESASGVAAAAADVARHGRLGGEACWV